MRPSRTSEPAVSARRASSASDASDCRAVPSVHTPTSTTRSSRSCRYSTSVTSSSSVDSPLTRRSDARSSSSISTVDGSPSYRSSSWSSVCVSSVIVPPWSHDSPREPNSLAAGIGGEVDRGALGAGTTGARAELLEQGVEPGFQLRPLLGGHLDDQARLVHALESGFGDLGQIGLEHRLLHVLVTA